MHPNAKFKPSSGRHGRGCGVVSWANIRDLSSWSVRTPRSARALARHSNLGEDQIARPHELPSPLAHRYVDPKAPMAHVLLASLHFSPAFASHLVAYAKGYQALGHSVTFLIHPSYRIFGELEATAPTLVAAAGEDFDPKPFTHALFQNMAPANAALAGRLKTLGRKVIYVYHEPWESLGTYLGTEGAFSTLKLALAHRFSVGMLRVSDRIVLSSQRALEIYRQGDIRYNPTTTYIPLLFDDEYSGEVSSGRQFVSYIGTICQGHAFDAFVRFMEHSADRGLDFRFLLASRSPQPTTSAFERTAHKLGNRLTVQCGRSLTNDEINQFYLQSFCTWNLYRRTTQSGVLPRAQMLGTPSLASPVGSLPEFMRDGMEGVFLPEITPQTIQDAAGRIRNDLDRYSLNCRSNFLRTFHYQANLENLRETL